MDAEVLSRREIVSRMDELAKAAGYGSGWVAIQHMRVGRSLGGGLDVPIRALSRLLVRTDPMSIDYEPADPEAGVDRVVFCDQADVRPVTATLRALGLESRTEVRVWETPNNGAVAYIRLDTLRELVGGDHA